MPLELITAGESHGRELVAVLSGIPAGLRLDREGIDRELSRRQHGHGRGGRQKIERDRVEVRAGLRDSLTLGSPLLLAIANRDWENWSAVMDPWAVDAAQAARRRLTAPRPGHADLAGAWKYDHAADLRNVLERASARETAARVAARRGVPAAPRLVRGRDPLRRPRPRGRRAPRRPAVVGRSRAGRRGRAAAHRRPRAARRSSSRRSTPPGTPARRSAAWSASSREACRPGSAPTPAGTSASTDGWPRR